MNNQKDKAMNPKRRKLLAGLAVSVGVAGVSGGASIGVAASEKAVGTSTIKKGLLFSQHQMQMLRALCEVVIPKTDTPSAAELNVHLFIDTQLTNCHSIGDQQKIKNLLLRLDEVSYIEHKKHFNELLMPDQKALLLSLEAGQLGFISGDDEHFKFLKNLMAYGYFTTQVGATQVLKYQAIPGGFKGSIPYASVGTTWGSLAYY